MSHPVTFSVGMTTVTLEDVGALMNAEFQLLYTDALTSRPPNWTRHNNALFQYLNAHASVPEHDAYFSNLTIMWQWLLSAGNYVGAVDLWHDRIRAATDWENAHAPSKVHKGTPLYFLGVSHILSKNLERGFLAMHRALDEDTRTRHTSTPDTPSYALVTMNSSKVDQYFRPWVADLVAYAHSKVAQFRNSRNGTLTLAQLQARVLANSTFREEAFYFVSSCAVVREYEKGPLRVEAESQFGSVIELRALFEMCVVLDMIIGSKSPPTTWKFIDRTAWLFAQAGGHTRIRDDLGDINQKAVRHAPLAPMISGLLDLTYLFRGNRQPTRLEADLALAYLIRNYGAHVLQGLPIVHNRFSEILDAILASIFVAVQTLLP